MSPRPPEVDVEFSVDDGVAAAWDANRIAELVRAIVAREAADGSLIAPGGREDGPPGSEAVLAEDGSADGEAADGSCDRSLRPAAVEDGSADGEAVDGAEAGHQADGSFHDAAGSGLTMRYLISLHLVSDDRVQALNAEHRAIDAPTDVLSFPLHGDGFVTPPGEPVNLGDVVVSHQRAVEQATEYGHSVDRELAYLVAHGVLHILGYDHEIDADKTIMRRREEAALEPLGYTRPA